MKVILLTMKNGAKKYFSIEIVILHTSGISEA
jgi:hypothetical protein